MKTGIIFGISGTIGKRLNQTLQVKGYDVYGTYNHNLPKEISADKLFHLPVEKVEMISEILSKVKPDFVVMALRGDFDKQLTLHLRVADYLKINGGRMIFCSTSNVFDAATDFPHDETDTPKAESDYGQFKNVAKRMSGLLIGT